MSTVADHKAGNPKLPCLPAFSPEFACLEDMGLVLHWAELHDFPFGDLPPELAVENLSFPCSSALLHATAHTTARLSSHHARALLAQVRAFAVFTALSRTGAAPGYKYSAAEGSLHTPRLFAFPTPSLIAAC